MPGNHYDLIVVGSGPGGASLAHRLAPTGRRILLIERGDYLPREQENWSSKTVFVDGKYQAPETWHGAKGETFHPGLHYYVGGNSKVYGAALFRLRERDFDEVQHQHGISPAWPLKYDTFEPFYTEAEALYAVHGVQRLGLGVERLERVVLQRPGGGDAMLVLHFVEVALAQAEQGGAIHLGVAADVVVQARMERLALGAVPGLGGLVLAIDEHRLAAPVLLLARQIVAALDQQDAPAGGRQAMGERCAAGAGADDNKVIVIARHP